MDEREWNDYLAELMRFFFGRVEHVVGPSGEEYSRFKRAGREYFEMTGSDGVPSVDDITNGLRLTLDLSVSADRRTLDAKIGFRPG